MALKEMTIPCPACSEGKILLQPDALSQGASFGCNRCEARLSLSADSQAFYSDQLERLSEAERETRQERQRAQKPTL